MAKIKEIPYPGKNHGSFEQEWVSHKGVSDWWYATGVLFDDAGAMYSYQVTLIKAHVGIITPWLTHLALTEMSTGKHHFFANRMRNEKDILLTENSAERKDILSIVKGETGMHIQASAEDYSFTLDLDYGKGAFWHCDNGLLLMGSPTTKETTLYYSYPNMPTRGTVSLGGKTFQVTGKSWFDKQFGPYHLTARECHWDWFSLRFFDDEEVMLFSFPQGNYQDGTYIKADSSSRLTGYTIQEEQIVELTEGKAAGTKFPYGWQIHLPGIKEEHYTIKPLTEGQLNGVYFEMMCDVINSKGEKVGHCFVELLPGVRNKNFMTMMI